MRRPPSSRVSTGRNDDNSGCINRQLRQRTLRTTLRPLMSELMGMASYAPTYFLDLMDDDVESNGSSIGDVAPSHRLSWECVMADAPG